MKKKGLKFLLTAILFLSAVSISAQNLRMEKPHEFRFGIGAGFIDDDLFEFNYWGTVFDQSNIFRTRTYLGDLRGTPTFTLNYQYQVKKWFSIGLRGSYRATWQKLYYTYDDAVVSSEHSHYFGIMPMARFDWFRSNFVTLYSSVGLGVGYRHQKGARSSNRLFTTPKNEAILIGNLTPIGITMGRTFFFFAEGSIGLLQAGFGYRLKN